MSDRYDRERNENRYDNEAAGGSFVMGLLTGTVLGAGLGILFAPKSGSEIRTRITEQAGSLANNAQEGYRRASETAGEWADKGRTVVDRAREAVSRGAEEASRYADDAADKATKYGNDAADRSTAAMPSTGSSGSFGGGTPRG